MTRENSVIRNWIPERLIVPLLAISLLPHLMLLSMFSLNSTFTASFLDVEADDLQFMFSMAYGLIVCGLFLHNRLFGAINVKAYLLLMTMLNILVLMGMTVTTNPQAMLVLRFLQGPMTLFEGAIILPILMSHIKSRNAKFIGYAVLYGLMLTSDKFTTSIIKFAIENYSHNVMVYSLVALHVMALLIYLLIFNSKRMFPKIPLYQLNLSGVMLMVICLISGAYFFIYGKRYDWFDSPRIVIALGLCILCAALFVLFQMTSKRPLYHFSVLKSKRVVFGIFIFFIFYILRSGMGNIYQVMSVVWKWPWEYILKVQYINVAGSVLGVVISYLLFARQLSFRRIFVTGFLLLAVSMLWFSFLFYPDTTVGAIGIPLFLEGVGQGIIFTPLVFFMIGSVHASISSHASQTGTAIRFWSTTIGFALMQNLLLYLSTKYEFLLTKNLDQTHPVFQGAWSSLMDNWSAAHLENDAVHLSVMTLKAKLAAQALLIANMEIFRWLAIVGFGVFMLILLYRPLLFAWKRRHGQLRF